MDDELTEEEREAIRNLLREYERKKWAWGMFFRWATMIGGFVIFITATANFWAGLFKKLGKVFGG